MKIDASVELTDALAIGNNLHLRLSFSEVNTAAVRELTRFVITMLDEIAAEIPATKTKENPPNGPETL